MKSLREVEEHWSVYDVLDANVTLDLWEELEREAYARARAEAAASRR